MSKVSPYPPARVARLVMPHGKKLGAVLVPRPMGYLSVQLFFHGVPVEGRQVTFFVSPDGDPDGAKGEQIGDPLLTTADGIACAARLVPAGLYFCEVENQPPTIVGLAPSLDEPVPVVLPIGRPFVDVDEAPEFDPDFEVKTK